ncbi:hypothetical protein HZA57_05175, partial [Candidatus Poribacteria bacterium]|nr:hypothetical protein [Candidatus Poribacteria bacterium]
ATPIERNKPTGNPVAAMESPKVPAKQSVANAAQASGVKVIQYSEQGNTVRVKVQWISDNAAQGGDFLDALINAGVLRDFENKPPVMYRDKQGRAVRTVEYTLFLY